MEDLRMEDLRKTIVNEVVNRMTEETSIANKLDLLILKIKLSL